MQALQYVTFLTIGYMVARGLAKSGTRSRYEKGPIFAWYVPATTSRCRGIPAKAGPRASVATSGFGRAGSSEWLNLIGNLFAGRDVIAMIGT